MSDTPAAPAAPAAPRFTDLQTLTAKLQAKADYGTSGPRAGAPAPATPAAPVQPTATPPPARTAEIAGDPETQKRVSKLEADNLALKGQISTLEASKKDADTLAQVRKLYGEGKKMDAIAMLAGADPTQEMEALLAAYLEHPSADNESALAQRADELQKKIDAESAARKELEGKIAAREQQEQQQGLRAFALHALDGAVSDSGAPLHEICSRPENRADAAQKVIEKLPKLAIDKGLDPEHVTPDAARALLVEAYALVEADFEAEGKRLEAEAARFRRKSAETAQPPRVIREQQTPQSTGSPGDGADRNPPAAPQTRPLSKPPVFTERQQPASTLDAVLAKNRERARY